MTSSARSQGKNDAHLRHVAAKVWRSSFILFQAEFVRTALRVRSLLDLTSAGLSSSSGPVHRQGLVLVLKQKMQPVKVQSATWALESEPPNVSRCPAAVPVSSTPLLVDVRNACVHTPLQTSRTALRWLALLDCPIHWHTALLLCAASCHCPAGNLPPSAAGSNATPSHQQRRGDGVLPATEQSSEVGGQ
jgi:hypothetical protein